VPPSGKRAILQRLLAALDARFGAVRCSPVGRHSVRRLQTRTVLNCRFESAMPGEFFVGEAFDQQRDEVPDPALFELGPRIVHRQRNLLNGHLRVPES
jgi:hypothetical protein